MEGSHHVNWSSIIYRRGAIHRTEIERPFLAGKDFKTNLEQFLLPYHVIISNVHVYSFRCRISHAHGRAPKTVLHARKKLIYESLNSSSKDLHLHFKGTFPVIFTSVLLMSVKQFKAKDSRRNWSYLSLVSINCCKGFHDFSDNFCSRHVYLFF